MIFYEQRLGSFYLRRGIPIELESSREKNLDSDNHEIDDSAVFHAVDKIIDPFRRYFHMK